MSCVRLRLRPDNMALAVPVDLDSVGRLASSKVAIKASLLKPHRNNNPERQD